MFMSITVEQALQLLMEHTPILEEEEAALPKSLGRILTHRVYARYSQPPFDRSPLDGYALRAADAAEASPANPAVLKVVDKLYAGDISSISVQPGQAVRLMTGSVIPKGADCVIRQEDTDGGERFVRVYQRPAAGNNICRQGEEYPSGECLIPAGQRVDAAAAAVAAGAGVSALTGRRRAKIAVISTGSELQQPGKPLEPGKIYNSNAAFLTANLQQMGVEWTESLPVEDDTKCIARALSSLADGADMILTTGGVSVGQKDLMEAAVLRAGGSIVFHGIAMKPGMPAMFAVLGHKMLLCLSGNPFSAAAPFFLFVKPVLAA